MATSPVASRTNTDTRLNPAMARLVLAVGSRAGREAPLQHGYYMIGRHSECQIRPKSRSVSRRHCLLFQDDQGLKVFDLESTAGTRVNDRRIVPKTWNVLRHGDTLRCGKVAFRIEFGGAKADQGNALPQSSPHRDPSGSMPVGKAWHDVDIAGFLEGQDDADRQRRYESIRGGNKATVDQASDSIEDLQTTIETDVDLDLFEDAFDDPNPNEFPTSAGQASEATGRAHVRGEVSDASADPGSIRGGTSKPEPKPKRASNPAIPKTLARAPRRRFTELSLDAERWKLIGLGLVLVVALGALGYSAYRFYAGPSVRVLNNID